MNREFIGLIIGIIGFCCVMAGPGGVIVGIILVSIGYGISGAKNA